MKTLDYNTEYLTKKIFVELPEYNIYKWVYNLHYKTFYDEETYNNFIEEINNSGSDIAVIVEIIGYERCFKRISYNIYTIDELKK